MNEKSILIKKFTHSISIDVDTIVEKIANDNGELVLDESYTLNSGTKIVKGHKYIFLYVSPKQTVALKKDSFEEGEQEELITLINSKTANENVGSDKYGLKIQKYSLLIGFIISIILAYMNIRVLHGNNVVSVFFIMLLSGMLFSL